MKVLVIGSGAREHALAWAIRRSPSVSSVFVAPGNAGTALLARNVAIQSGDIPALIEFAKREEVDLTVVGPEGPLILGVVDRFREAGLAIYGPTAAAAQLEGSKAFAKDFMRRHRIPTAEYAVFDDASAAKEYVRAIARRVVVKADGLAAGKGVVVASTMDEAEQAIDDMLLAKKFGASGSRVVVEEFLEGEEVSVHAICAGTAAVLLPSSQDHKRAYDGDTGPNTGGMGAIAPVSWVSDSDLEQVRRNVILPVLAGMQKESAPFTGTLYVGLMWTANGPRVLEFNVRFGDPETEALMPLLAGDVASLLLDAANGKLPSHIETRAGSAAAIVIAAKGYPDQPETGTPVEGLNDIPGENVAVFHGGTRTEGSTTLSTSGRILAVSAWGDDLAGALQSAYVAVGRVKISGSFFRSDIGRRHAGAHRERTKP